MTLALGPWIHTTCLSLLFKWKNERSCFWTIYFVLIDRQNILRFFCQNFSWVKLWIHINCDVLLRFENIFFYLLRYLVKKIFGVWRIFKNLLPICYSTSLLYVTVRYNCWCESCSLFSEVIIPNPRNDSQTKWYIRKSRSKLLCANGRLYDGNPYPISRLLNSNSWSLSPNQKMSHTFWTSLILYIYDARM